MSVFVGVKVKDASTWLLRFIGQMEKVKGLSRIAIIYGESRDSSLAHLLHWRNRSEVPIEIYKDPYYPPSERHGAITSARADKDFQTLHKVRDEKYFLKVDCDLVQLPVDFVEKLISRNKDVVAPYVWIENRETPTFFDSFVFRKEGCRFHCYRPPGLLDEDPIEVDSVGTCWLATREAHLAGKFTNPYPQIQFFRSLKDQGFQIWADPTVNIIHMDLERLGVKHHPWNIPISRVPFIDYVGNKFSDVQVTAELFHTTIKEYENWFKQSQTEAYSHIVDFIDSRPLITASYKVFNESRFLPYSLKSVYPYVDRIDIVEGATKPLWKESNDGRSTDGTVEIIKSFPDPDHKIKLIQEKWFSREQMQARLLEHCCSKWMLFIDGDEIIDPNSMKKARLFCEKNSGGNIVYARPERFINFWHDFYHIAYSLNPLSPWFHGGLPHAFLVHRDVPGLNFLNLHTMAMDGFGVPVSLDSRKYWGRQKVLDGVFIYHFGNAKGVDKMYEKLKMPHARLLGNAPEDPWFSGVMPDDMMIERFKGKLPKLLRDHPDRKKKRIRITQTKPHFEFEVI